MRVLLVDNDRLLLESLGLAMEARHTDLDVRLAGNARQAADLARAESFELIVLDWWLDQTSAATCFAELRDLCPDARIVVMSGDDRPELVYEVLELRAAGFLCKNAAGFETLREAIDIVANGGVYMPGHLAARSGVSPSVNQRWTGRELADCFPQLTSRQLSVLRVLLRGVSDKVIARELDIALNTVKSHVTEVLKRLGVSCRAEAVATAARMGARID